MTNNVFSKTVVGGSFNINSILDKKISRAGSQSIDDEADEVRREAELEAVRKGYYEKGKMDTAAEFEQKAEEIKNSAYEEGYQNGKNKVFQELEPKYLAMKAIFDQWNEDKGKFLTELESDAIELSLAIERKIVGYEIQKSKEPLKYVINEVMNMIQDQKKLRIRVSHEDEEYFRKGVMDFIKTFGEDVEVTCDPNVNQGGFIIETSIGKVDASVETRWNMISDAFFSGIERGDNDIFRDMFTKTGEYKNGAICGESDQGIGPVS